MVETISKTILCSLKRLPEERWVEAAQKAIEINPLNHAPLAMLKMVMPAYTPTPMHLAAVATKYWGAKGVHLTVGFLDNPPADLRKHIILHMNAWNKTANVKFDETKTDPLVRIAREGGSAGGFWSYLGTDILLIEPDKPTMNLEGFTMDTPESEFRRIVRHETGHTLGFPHEHMRRERVEKIDPEKAFKYFEITQGWKHEEVMAQVLTPLEDASISGALHSDPPSIMCYQLPGEITKDGVPIIGGTDISNSDFTFAGSIYHKRHSRNNYRTPVTRPLRVYSFDPLMGRRLNNHMVIRVPYEDVVMGPVGEKLAVIDYDISNEKFYEPVDLDHPAVLMANGLEPSESDPRFHQQMVYAIASDTIQRFEFALGRPIRWRPKHGSRLEDPFHRRLRLFPHAFQQANAFYDPELRAILFGYFEASRKDTGDVLPGQIIFTCLSHDIIVHEMTHALIDSQREYLTDATGPDAVAFHEAFADIVALFQHFTYKDVLIDTIYRTGGMIHHKVLDSHVPMSSVQAAIIPELTEDNPLVGLAHQFGNAIGSRAALRSAIGTPPNFRDLEKVTEPHERGAILVSAVFDAFFTIYIKRIRDLMRIARSSESNSHVEELHPDLVNRLAAEASKTAVHFMNICIRALDYLPPVDVQFGDFLRAIITADSDLVPDDPYYYRGEIIKAFRLRGIIPKEVRSYSEEALRWPSPESTGKLPDPCVSLEFDAVKTGIKQRYEPDAEQNAENARVLCKYANDNRAALVLDNEYPIQTKSFHPIHRISPSGRLVTDYVVEFLQQREDCPLEPDNDSSPKFKFRGGSTVLFDESGCVRYVIAKSINSEDRLERQRDFHCQQIGNRASAAYCERDISPKINFQLLHGGK